MTLTAGSGILTRVVKHLLSHRQHSASVWLQLQRPHLWQFTPRAGFSPAGKRSASSVQRPAPPLRSFSGATETWCSLIGWGKGTLGPLNTSSTELSDNHYIPLYNICFCLVLFPSLCRFESPDWSLCKREKDALYFFKICTGFFSGWI